MATKMSLMIFALFLFYFGSAGAFYSINYVADLSEHPRVLNAGGAFLSAPSAEHVADVYARLSGHAPLLWSDEEKLPAIDVFAERKVQPLILEVHGGSKYPGFSA